MNPDNKPQSKEKTMLTPELSRLKGAPSTLQRRTQELERHGGRRTSEAWYEIKPDTCKSSKIPISACVRCEEREEERGACISPRRWLELVTDMANEKDVGPDSLRGVCLIERVEDPAVLSQHRGIGQGDATGMSPSSPSVAVRRASRKMMHDRAVRVMAEGASGRALPVTRGTACGGVVMAPAGKTPKTKGRRRKVKGVHGVLLDWEEVVREDVNEDTMQVRYHGREPVTKGTVKTRIDFTGKPLVE